MEDIQQEVFNAYEVIKNGGIILYPTDTVWGIGCDANNPEAIKKIYALKKRAESKSMIVLVNERIFHRVFTSPPAVTWDILDCSEKPTTLILDNPKYVAKEVVSADNSLGVRIVEEPFCFRLIEKMKSPLVSTSANISGEPSPANFSEISKEIIEGVDYVVNLRQNDMKPAKPSTIIKLKDNSLVTIIRK
ncbi:threonylcarbamoyl-AMP synthase [Myroides odoratimimus]|uniref:L-threonylcarbamoyladenylate synthase n=1 Tax=Myroides odoratimimus TaxID=76832 RepID=UPI0025774E79|nr:L-threonylcarbamoyladenylate synthase [Myroides odoratimimus]MDM1098061.1 threonylcarbamoyl-AMP synthase [Myroides odoratimimus]MDM1328600.1 threonylcarbamoyl-AMP synthase [Myroides odoratimimus]MDM1443029.1 threonylcarbamoyl-AMP synthase [Myroides odoratimimus]MDM1448453.1 threonylcarbamoyl-AMP synthase [Myroides odoratimimus]MDM1453567.1 threonylcarbamoyl-AMP synthase [Myroides odoratimimus]